MYKNFKIDDIDILNIYELQENFSLEKIYFNLEPFKKFAEVHCKSLKKTYYDANGKLNLSERYTYVFWYDVLCGEEDKAEYDGYTEYLFSDAEEFKEKVKKHLRHEDVEKEIIEECECFGLKEKLKYICEKVPEEIKTPKNILLLLAICELSQVNVLKINDFIFRKESNSDKKNQKGIERIPSRREITLNTSGKPYRYWYYDADFLGDGEIIETVKIKASGLPGKKVTIELYSENNETPVAKKELQKDEFVFCNIAGGKIIKFLPDAEQSLLKCNGYSEEEKATIKAMLLKNNVGVFAVGNKEYGYLTVENDKLNYLFYEPAKMESVEFRLRCIIDNIVEIKVITQRGYQILTNKGTVIDNYTEKNIRAVSLDR